jgi:hypothetical protein
VLEVEFLRLECVGLLQRIVAARNLGNAVDPDLNRESALAIKIDQNGQLLLRSVAPNRAARELFVQGAANAVLALSRLE